MERYGIKEHPAIKTLWGKRKMWIMAYFKGLYCGRMTSTQQSESTNRVLKDCFVNIVTSLNQFAEKMLEGLQHMDHMEAEESHCSHVTSSLAVLMHYFTLLHFINAVVTVFICVCDGFVTIVAGTNGAALSCAI
jgi:hypothetical protein